MGGWEENGVVEWDSFGPDEAGLGGERITSSAADWRSVQHGASPPLVYEIYHTFKRETKGTAPPTATRI